MRGLVGRILYGALFVVVLPALLLAWERGTRHVVRAPVFTSPGIGALIAGLGAALVLGGWIALARHGGGLPMNAFPPPRRVSRGVYAIVAHPIYVGACAIGFGASIALGSSPGFWLVSPALALGCTALVYGYEKHDLEARLGAPKARPWLSLPPAEDSAPRLLERLALFPLVFLPWGALYQTVIELGVPADACETALPFEAHWPVWEESEAVYGLTYAFALLAPLIARTRRDLRALAVRALLASAVAFPLYLALPLVAVPRPFTPHGWLGHALAWERAIDTPGAALPSFHVVWALIAAEAWASRFPRARWAWRGLALLIAASCITTGMHSLADVAAGGLAFVVVERRVSIWRGLRGLTERLANSWKEVRVGRARIINHGGWAALGTTGGVLLVGTLAGPGHTLSIFIAATAGLVLAALWAQFIEGSPALLRPYGFYGGVLGVVLGSLAAPLTGTSVWLLLGAYAVAGPFIQACGRVRCLVQGCCHGREAPEAVGIRYTHPRSRVVRLSPLGGVPVHPTPLYSILWNVVTALAVGRLWSLGVPLSFIGGTYLAMNGFGRFVEEAYRGEPQTPIYAGLRLYQWVALGGVLAGGFVMTLDTASAPPPAFNWPSVAAAALFGAVTWFALGVDFPESNRRFARLV